MDRKLVNALKMEYILWEECKDYIKPGAEPRDEEMGACVKAYEAMLEYREILEKKENASGGTNT